MDYSIRRQWENSGKDDDDDEALSFSGMIIDGSSREGAQSPGSWSSLDFEFSRTSSGAIDGDDMDEWFPADLFFSNGQLLPHVFPLPVDRQQSFSGQKDSTASSGWSSRQNSWTTASSASLDFSDGTGTTKRAYAKAPGSRVKRVTGAKSRQSTCFVVPRWQFLFPMPSKPSISGSGSTSRESGRSTRRRSSRKASREEPGIWTWLMRKILGALLSTCRDCHSLQPIIQDEYTLARK